MIGLGTVRHHGDRIEVGCGEDLLRRRAEWVDRVLDVRRREHVGVGEDVLDVVHPGHDHVPEPFGPEQRVLVAQPSCDRVRVGEVVGGQG